MSAAKVLIVERNAKIAGLLSGHLRQTGHDASDVRNGAEAAMELRGGKFDVILMDHRVTMGGVKTARLLRLHPKHGNIPVILALPPDQGEARVLVKEAHSIGLKNFVIKPFRMDALQKKLAQVADEKVVEKPTDIEIREEIRSISNLPTMPAVRGRLLALLSKSDKEVDIRKVAHTIEQDPGLATQVMRVCNSTYFGFQGNLMSQAVAFLGVEAIRKIVQTSIIYDFFGSSKSDDRGFSMMDLWKHSLATGMSMEIIGKADKKKTHFMPGVLHDIGKVIFKIRFPDHFNKVVDLVEKEGKSMLEAEEELLGISHADCGGEVALHWDLPGEVRTAIAQHHKPGEADQHRRLAAMVHIADIAARRMEIGYAGDDLIPPVDPYAQRIQKSVDEILTRADDFKEQIDSIIGDLG